MEQSVWRSSRSWRPVLPTKFAKGFFLGGGAGAEEGGVRRGGELAVVLVEATSEP